MPSGTITDTSNYNMKYYSLITKVLLDEQCLIKLKKQIDSLKSQHIGIFLGVTNDYYLDSIFERNGKMIFKLYSTQDRNFPQIGDVKDLDDVKIYDIENVVTGTSSTKLLFHPVYIMIDYLDKTLFNSHEKLKGVFSVLKKGLGIRRSIFHDMLLDIDLYIKNNKDKKKFYQSKIDGIDDIFQDTEIDIILNKEDYKKLNKPGVAYKEIITTFSRGVPSGISSFLAFNSYRQRIGAGKIEIKVTAERGLNLQSTYSKEIINFLKQNEGDENIIGGKVKFYDPDIDSGDVMDIMNAVIKEHVKLEVNANRTINEDNAIEQIVNKYNLRKNEIKSIFNA